MFKSLFLMVSIFFGVVNIAFAVDDNLGCILGSVNLKRLQDPQEAFKILVEPSYSYKVSDGLSISVTSPYMSSEVIVRSARQNLHQRLLFLYQRPLINLKNYQSELFMREHKERIFLSVYRTEEKNSKIYAKLDCPPNVQCKAITASRFSKEAYGDFKKEKLLEECASSITMKFPNGLCITYTLKKLYGSDIFKQIKDFYYYDPRLFREQRVGCNI